MSIIKNPIVLSGIASALVFIVMYYWYNPSIIVNKDKKKKRWKSNREYKKTKECGINETIVISEIIAGLTTWYIASSYFTCTQESETVNNLENQSNILTKKQKSSPEVIDQVKIPHIKSDDPTRSYNLIGAGLNMPSSGLNIPNVLIDYK